MFHWITLTVAIISVGVTVEAYYNYTGNGGGNVYGGGGGVQPPSASVMNYPSRGPFGGTINTGGSYNSNPNTNFATPGLNYKAPLASPGQNNYVPQNKPNQLEHVDNSAVLGYIAKPGQFPYQVSIELNGHHFCGGAILAPIVIITAAHCVFQQPMMAMNVLSGTIDRQRGGMRSHVAAYKIHPNYNPTTKDFDIAIIFLKGPLTFTQNIQPVQLPKNNEQLYANAMVTITGWGGEGGNGRLSNQLKFIYAPLMDHNVCAKNFRQVTNTMICVGELSGQRASCPGDSGGPLTIGNILIGVMSWGYGCNSYGKPTVYSFVAGVRQWISQTAMV